MTSNANSFTRNSKPAHGQPTSSGTHENPESDSRSERLNEILLNYVEACEAGNTPARETVLNAHPDLHDELTLFFEERDRLQWFGNLLRDEQLDHEQTPTPADPERGRLGDFRLIREVGRGGMGIVYEAEQISLGRRVALKILPFAAALDPRQLQRFRNEAAAAAHLRHENIVSVHAVGHERGVHYYAMQFIDGQSLASLIREFRTPPDDRTEASTAPACRMVTEGKPRTSQWFDWVARMGHQAAMALEHAHQTGVVHRDIKPANLLLDSRGQVWFTDFGLAQVANESGLTFHWRTSRNPAICKPRTDLRTAARRRRSSAMSIRSEQRCTNCSLRPPFLSDRHELVLDCNSGASFATNICA
ncbi:MAG: serine/threonine-protein kinase [Planctomycetaceae bacterium]